VEVSHALYACLKWTACGGGGLAVKPWLGVLTATGETGRVYSLSILPFCIPPGASFSVVGACDLFTHPTVARQRLANVRLFASARSIHLPHGCCPPFE
jgi:hypothetical protein